MDINDLRGLGTVFAMAAFLGVCFWAYSSRKKQDFEEAASLPFVDDTLGQEQDQQNPGQSKPLNNENNKGAAK